MPLKDWVYFWRSRFVYSHSNSVSKPFWQRDFWDTQLRRADSYTSKWRYVENNPVRHGHVVNSRDWPFKGEIFVFENGNDFLDQLNSGKLNQNGDLKTLVLLDINMPEIWGLDLLNNLDEDYDNIEYMDIIMVSSSKLKSDVEKSSRYNSVLGYLEKPLNIDKINSILTK